MILVLGGTAESREIVSRLRVCGMPVMATAVTDYGGKLLRESTEERGERPEIQGEHLKTPGKRQQVRILTGALDEASLARVITENRVTAVIDATHPYAGNISCTAEDITAKLGTTYIRYLRPAAAFDDHPLIRRAATWAEAADMAMEAAEASVRTAESGKTVFLTIGSKNLRPFTEAAKEKDIRLVARVLPDPAVLAECLKLGLMPRDIIACQGPFDESMNLAMLTHCRAGVLVTKDSGAIGGTEAKLAAARALHIPVVLVERPEEGKEGPDRNLNLTGKTVVSDINKLIRMVSENESGDNHTGTRE
ncbi:MAG: precorrin-6A reductase [Bacillota bacterium]